MFIVRFPRWLDALERSLSWLSLPNLSLYLVVAQVFGFLFVQIRPDILAQMSLDPAAILQGQWWRVISFIALPISFNLLFQLIAVWFLYFIVNLVESSLGEFKTTFYLLIAVVLSNLTAFLLHTPITASYYIQLSFFLAAAMLEPNLEILLFLVLPVKIKYLGYISLAFFVFSFLVSPWPMQIFLFAMLANFFLYFYPGMISEIRYRLDKLKK